MADSDSDEAPQAISTTSGRAQVASRTAKPTLTLKQSQKEAKAKQTQLVTNDLRGDDYLPPELLQQVEVPAAAATSVAQDAPKREKRKRERRQTERDERPKPVNDGLPQVVREEGTVRIAVLKSGGLSQAPVKGGLEDFMQKHLYGGRVQRAPAASLSSMKAQRGRFGAASNFATAHFDPAPAAHVEEIDVLLDNAR